MYQNTNKEAVKELAKNNMQFHKQRSLIAVLAIALTTILITTLFTVGISFYTSMKKGTDVSPGPMADGGIRASLSQYEEISKRKEVQWAGYVRPCNLGSLHNKEMVGITAKLYAPNPVFLEENKVTLQEGRFPKSSGEVAISNTLAQRIKIKKTGEMLDLHPVILENGREKEIRVSMKVTGIYSSPIGILHDTYEELYTSERFLDEYAPEMKSQRLTAYVKLKGEGSRTEKYQKLQEIAEQVTGNGEVTFRFGNSQPAGEILVWAGFLLLIIFCGYLIIYNIFTISVVNEIRFLGLIKTIGATKRQIRLYLSWQVKRLAAAGIVLGLAAGYLIGIWAAPVVLAQTSYSQFYEIPKNPLYFVPAVLFSVFTVWISCRKSYKIACGISPVEASRYTDTRKKKKVIWSVLSFALSGTIFIVVYNITFGYDVEKMVDRYNSSDVRVVQKAAGFGSEEDYIPIEESLADRLEQLPFVKGTDTYYSARSTSSKDSSFGLLKIEGVWEKEWENAVEHQREMLNKMGKPVSLDEMKKSMEVNGFAKVPIGAAEPDALKKEEKSLNVLEGKLDADQFKTGDFIIYYRSHVLPEGEDGAIHAGDTVSFTVYEPKSESLQTLKKQVMAVVTDKNMYGRNLIGEGEISLYLSEKTFQELYPGYRDFVSAIQIDGCQELTKSQYEQIERMVQETFNSQIQISSKYMTRVTNQTQKNSMMLLGMFLAGIFGLIGISNVTNTLITGVLARKIEFAAMQSLGMTKKQMFLGLTLDSLKLSGLSVLLAVAAGGILAGRMEGLFTGFSESAFVTSMILLAAVMIFMSVMTAGGLTGFLNRKSVVERLREAE